MAWYILDDRGIDEVCLFVISKTDTLRRQEKFVAALGYPSKKVLKT